MRPSQKYDEFKNIQKYIKRINVLVVSYFLSRDMCYVEGRGFNGNPFSGIFWLI